MGTQVTGTFWLLVLAGISFLLSALFSATETALLSLSRPRLKKLISQRPELAPAFTEWLSAPQYLLTTILIGNTMTNVVATLLVTDAALLALPKIHRAWVETGCWLLMTFVLFIFAEFIPKTLARHYPQRVTLTTLHGMSLLTRALAPILRGVIGLLDKLPMFEGMPVGRLSVYTVEELREMIRAGGAGGQVTRRSMQMMERALALNRLPVSQIMTPFAKIESVNLGLSPEAVVDRVAEIGRTRVPAWRGDSPRRIGGYLHVKDLLLVWRGALPLNPDLLLRRPLTVKTNTPASELLEEFRKGTAHIALVNDEQGVCQGMVTLEDVLEELVGEILDEYDVENPRGIR